MGGDDLDRLWEGRRALHARLGRWYRPHYAAVAAARWLVRRIPGAVDRATGRITYILTRRMWVRFAQLCDQIEEAKRGR